MKKYLPILVMLLLSVIILGAGGSYAWFTATTVSGAEGKVGNIEIEIEYDPIVSDDTTEFEVTNTGTLPAYVRVGYTFMYKNEEDVELMKDVSGIAVDSFSLQVDGEPQDGLHQSATETVNGYNYLKRFLVPVDVDQQTVYYKLQPGESLTGVCTLSGVDPEGTLNVAWVAEALQANAKAVKNAESYGWAPDMAA